MSAPIWRRFRFSLRTLLVLLAVASVWLGWPLHLVTERKTLLEWLRWQDIKCESVSLAPEAIPGWQRWLGITWIRRHLGDERVIHISLPHELPESEKRRVSQVFPEAIVATVHYAVLDWSTMSAAEYAERKSRQTPEKAYHSDFQLMFMAPRQPPLGDLLAFAPRMRDDLIEAALAAVEAESRTVEFAVDSLVLASEVRALLSRRSESGDMLAVQNELTENLKRLKNVVVGQLVRTGEIAADDFRLLLIEYQLERCSARIAQLNREPGNELAAVSRAVSVYEKLRAGIFQASFGEGFDVESLMGVLHRSPLSQVIPPELADDSVALRDALRKCNDAVEQSRRKVEALYLAGARGGEAEIYHALRFRSAQLAAMSSEKKADLNGARAAWQEAIDQANHEVEATIAAFNAETVTVAELIDAVDHRATARQRFSELSGDQRRQLLAKQAHARVLFRITNGLLALYVSACHESPGMEAVDYAACHYILARCRLEQDSNE